MKALVVGERVKLTGEFLRNTGQQLGGEGWSVWVITGFSNGGRWAITNEVAQTGLYSESELKADPTLAFRRIAVQNLRRAP